MTKEERRIINEAWAVLRNVIEDEPEEDNTIHGHWKESEKGTLINGVSPLECSVCHATTLYKDRQVLRFTLPMPYCPACGAKMDEQQEVE